MATSEARALLDEAENKRQSALLLDPGHTYNLACLAALRGQEKECRKYLQEAKKYRSLPPVEHFRIDPDLQSVRDKRWFKELVRAVSKSG